MSTFIATINVPGYLPGDPDPPTFDHPADAWRYLADMREEALNEEADGAGNDTVHAELCRLADMGPQAPFSQSVIGPTPGYDGSHDLGMAYSVNLVTTCEWGVTVR